MSTITHQSMTNSKINLEEKDCKIEKGACWTTVFFTSLSFHHESVVATSYAVAKVIAKRSKPLSDEEFMKDCFLCVADFMFPEKKELVFRGIPLHVVLKT